MEVNHMSTGRDELWMAALYGREMEARAAIEELSLLPSHLEVRRFKELFAIRTHWIDRIDIVEALGRIADPESRLILVDIVKNNRQRLVKYYAVRNMIELGELSWLNFVPKNYNSSNFWQSLFVYQSFVSGKMPLDVLKETARTRHTRPGDHWDWLNQIGHEVLVKNSLNTDRP